MICHVCGCSEFEFTAVLWDELIKEWQLDEYEVDYINRQQGLHCKDCGANLRSIALAMGILSSYGFKGNLTEFVESSLARNFKVLEINHAGSLTQILERIRDHKLVTYPAFDMTKLEIDTSIYDLIIHSDTLEHVDNPVAALTECWRVLQPSGRCIFTVPIISGRLTRSRKDLTKSYHGAVEERADDFLVHIEFGADIWTHVLEAGFSSCTIHCLEYPAGLAIEARK
jgi:2-polyprenyl-3-methyl-5-hydroxy-6-metoxy-1,4-benzoquinol methylase